MSIRRITELPSLENFYVDKCTYDPDLSVYLSVTLPATLSDCVIEASLQKDEFGQYNSVKTKGQSILDTIKIEIEQRIIYHIAIKGGILEILSAKLHLDNSTLEFLNGSSIIAEPNSSKDGHKTSCYLHFDDIKISSDNTYVWSDNNLNLSGNPVVINDNLFVYTDMVNTNQCVNFTNSSNEILAQSCPTNENYVATCAMLQKYYSK